ncbi:MAG TPA: hypothetical protein VK212_09650, partial [Lentimicrobium sp.]|nr:hypothetical protein [Lentimicrobium sp.]
MQYRGTNWYEATSQVTVADVTGWQMRVSGFKATIIFLRSRIKRKNRDKQMIFIVRVRLSNLYFGVRKEF